MIYVDDKKCITITTRMSMLDVHRFLQNRADNLTKQGDDEVSIVDPNPSLAITKNSFQLKDGYYIDENSIKNINGGSWTDKNGNYCRLTIIGSVKGRAYKVITDGKLYYAPPEPNQNQYSAMYIRNGTFYKLPKTARSLTFYQDIIKSSVALSFAAPAPCGKSLHEVLEEL